MEIFYEFTELKKRKAQGGMDENSLLFAPYSRGLAVGNKYVFWHLDGQAVALDRKMEKLFGRQKFWIQIIVTVYLILLQ